MKTRLQITLRLALIATALTSALEFQAQISGAVFRDVNNDGVRQTTNPIEPMEYGVVVNAYSSANVLVGTTTTNISGVYSFSAAQAPSGLAVRLEFIVASGDQPSKRMASGRSNVQFVVAGPAAVNIDFAVASKKLYSNNANPWVATSSYTNGDPNVTGTGNAGDYDNVHVFPYDFSNDGGATRRTKNQYTGSVFGLAWQKESRTLFMSAYLKRHSGFGPHGIGAIYQTQIGSNGIPTAPTLLVDVTTIGINVGTDPRTDALPGNASTPNTDVGVFSQIGKRGIGSIELSNDGRELYIVNMYENKLQRINVGNPIKASFTASDVTGSWAIPDPNISGTEFHPMALKMKNNKFYIGGICSKQTTTPHNIADTVNMRGIVFEFDPVTNSFTEVLRFPLSHRKGFTNADYRYEFRNNYWSAWQNNGDISISGPIRTGLIGALLGSNSTGVYYAQPLFSAIEFDADGSMIIGIRDRFGDQGGYANYFESGNDPGDRYRVLSSGEVLRAGKNGSVWEFENGGSVTTNGLTTTTPGLTDNAPAQLGSWLLRLLTPWGGHFGPGGGYYYYNHNFSLTNVPSAFAGVSAYTDHYLKSNGGLAYLPGYNEVITTAIDPMNRSFANGLIKNVNLGSNAGNMAARMELFASASNDPARSGKAAALGDVEILLDAAAMEIGNRIWSDANGNGIQDATETGIAGVTVLLRSPGADGIYENGDDETWTVVTDADGSYYFDATVVNDSRRPSSWLGISSTNSGILPGFEYRIEIDRAQPVLTAFPWVSGINASANKAVNSDGIRSGNSVQYVVNPGGSTAAGSIFENDYNVDFGFVPAVLSVQQLDLKATMDKNQIAHISWFTTGEADVKQYHVERSIDGKTFTSVGIVSSKGDGNFTYGKDDDIASLASLVAYYRIRIENENGQVKYSSIVKVNLERGITVTAMPNPFNDHINLQVNTSKRTDATIRIFNVAGQVVKNKSIILEKGVNSILVNDMQQLPPGTYILDVQTGESSLMQKMLKR